MINNNGQRKRWVEGILICAVILLFLTKINLEKHMEIVGSQTLPSREIIWWLAESYPEEAVLGGAASALGFKEILSDFFFLQSIQYFGSRMESKEKKYKMIYPLLKAMGKLSPHFVPGYSFGALIMEETGHIDVAINLLDEGIENNPYAFELWIYRDFMIRLFKTHEYSKAIQGIKKAIKFEGHPPILERILAYAYEKNGQIKEAILQWRNVYFKEEDPHIKQTTYTHIERLLKILAEKT